MAQIVSYVKAQSNASYVGLVNAGEGSMKLSSSDNIVDWGSLLIAKDDFINLPDNTVINSVRLYYSAKVNGSNRKAGIRVGAGWVDSYTVNSDKTYSRGTYNKILDVFKGSEITSTSYSEKYETFGGITLNHLKHGLRLPFGAYENNSVLSCTLYVKQIRLIVDYTPPAQYYLDLNGFIDGASSGGISPAGTADVYINGALASNDCADYYAQHYYGSTYEIKDIRANTGYAYIGVKSGSLSGTITGDTAVVLEFKRLPPEITEVKITYGSQPVSKLNKVPCGEGFILSVGVGYSNSILG